MSSSKTHPFHILEPSPWPLVSSVGALLMALGAVLWMREYTQIVFWVGTGIVLYSAFGWWRDVIAESKVDHTRPVKVGLRYGMALFIVSEVMFFAAFFWAFFNSSLMPTDQMGNVWPPKGIETLDPFDLPYINTLLLLLSGTTLTWAHHSLVEGNMKDAAQKTALTVIIGFVFLCVQMFEYSHVSFSLDGGIYPSTFFLATGFHGVHVFIGVCFLAVCYFRTKAGHFTPDDHFGFEAAAWYWHFVDVVWLFLFVCIYWWGG